jgi:hypothetical protein
LARPESEAATPVELALELRLEPVTPLRTDETEAEAPDAEPPLAEAEPVAELYYQLWFPIPRG